MVSELPMWVIYDHPLDFPHEYVARKHVARAGGPEVTREVLTSITLNVLREQMQMMGLACLARSPEDDPVIVETWL